MSRERAAECAAGETAAGGRASEERVRMARELHDVIGHTISLINVQASAGLDLIDTQPEQSRAALTAIMEASKQALAELRAMLAALRQADKDAPGSLAPGLARLPDLLSLTQAPGLTVTTNVTGAPRPVPAAVDAAAYRIIQEALTNVARHAGPAAVTIRLTYGDHDLSISVDDDGCPGHPDGSADATAGSGIAGMQARAAALGGRLVAGPRDGGGFGVHASLPWPDSGDHGLADGGVLPHAADPGRTVKAD